MLKTVKFCLLHGPAQPVYDAKGKLEGYVCHWCRDPHSGGMILKKP